MGHAWPRRAHRNQTGFIRIRCEDVHAPCAAEPPKAVGASEAQLAVQKFSSPRQVEVIVALGVVGIHHVFNATLKRHTSRKAIGMRQHHRYSCGAADRMEQQAQLGFGCWTGGWRRTSQHSF